MDEELKPSETPPTEDHLDEAAARVARRAADAQVDGRMPAIYLGHGAPPLVDDALWVAAARRLGRRAAAAHGHPHGLGSLGGGAAHPGRHPRRRAAGLRLLRLSRALLPRRPTPRRRRPRWPRAYASCWAPGEQVAERPSAASTTAPTCRCSSCIPRPTCRCCRSRCPRSTPAGLLELGARLAPLRDEGVLVIGSGFLTHGLPFLRDFRVDAPPPAWSSEFDAWAAEALERGDADSLAHFREAPGGRYAHPTHRALRAAVRHPRRRWRRAAGDDRGGLLPGPLETVGADRLAGVRRRGAARAGLIVEPKRRHADELPISIHPSRAPRPPTTMPPRPAPAHGAYRRSVADVIAFSLLRPPLTPVRRLTPGTRPPAQPPGRRKHRHEHDESDELRLAQSQEEHVVDALERDEEAPERVEAEVEQEGHAVGLQARHGPQQDGDHDEQPELLVDRRGLRGHARLAGSSALGFV